MSIGYGIWSLVAFIIWIAVLAWVYLDAQEKGRSGCLWVFVVFFSGFLGLAVYLLFFHGSPVVQRHQAVNRSEDIKYRSMYRSEEFRGSQSPQKSYGSGTQPSLRADPAFVDEELERLLKEKKFSDARAYLKDMQEMAVEMNDKQGQANYKQYEARINRVASKTKIKRKIGDDKPGYGDYESRY